MKFYEALKAMVEDGAKIRLKHWRDRIYLKSKDGKIVHEDETLHAYLFTPYVLSDDWEIVPETMGFMEAMRALSANRRAMAYRGKWTLGFRVAIAIDEKLYMYSKDGKPEAHYGVSIADIEATDWIVESPTQTY